MAIVKSGGSGPRITILTWFWAQPNARFAYTASHVNAWAKLVKKFTTIDATIACVTDIPEGIDDWIKIIKPPDDGLVNIKSKTWSEKAGLPQCFRRLAMWRRDAADIFDTDIICWMDLDVNICGNFDHLFEDLTTDVRLLQGTSAKRPYNGGFGIIHCGARPQVYEKITPQGIKKSGEMYVGSDQAWMAYILGWGEERIGRESGVYCMTAENFKKPAGACICFFPGTQKLFADGTSMGTKVAPVARKKELLAFDDKKGYGKLFNPQRLIKKAEEAHPGDFCFIRLDQQGAQRDITKGIVEELNSKGVKTLPTLNEARLYDDKGAQYSVLKKWLPETYYIKDKGEALKIAFKLKYPIISKGIDGASSATVRILKDKHEALKEIHEAFSKKGMRSAYDRRQQGYIYWQSIVPDNDCDYRVIIAGDFAFGLVRRVREGTIFASGSGDNYPITLKNEKERIAVSFAFEIARSINTKWMAFDVVFNGEVPFVLEMSSSWSERVYRECSLFDIDGKDSGFKGNDSFSIAKKVLLEGEVVTPVLRKARDWRGAKVDQKYKLLKNCTLGKRGEMVTLSDRIAGQLKRNGIVTNPHVEVPPVPVPEPEPVFVTKVIEPEPEPAREIEPEVVEAPKRRRRKKSEVENG